MKRFILWPAFVEAAIEGKHYLGMKYSLNGFWGMTCIVNPAKKNTGVRALLLFHCALSLLGLPSKFTKIDETVDHQPAYDFS